MALNPKLRDWHGKRVWIIGASSGIGAALARQMARAGAQVILSARRRQVLLEVLDGGGTILPLDATDTEAVTAAWERLRRDGCVDLVVYCAGLYSPMRSWDMDLDEVRQTLDVNLYAVYQLLAACLPDMLRESRGNLCLVASVAGYTGLPKALAYGPSKAAMINLAQVLYTDLAPRGIGVYLVNPGFVETRLTQKNDFDMPALQTPEQAASAILSGFARGSFEIHFPKRFTFWMKRLAGLPDRLRFYLLSKAVQS